MSQHPDIAATKRNNRIVFACLGIVLGMGAMSYAAVPLYEVFCRVTGYGGTTQRADAAPTEISDRVMKIRFDATTSNGLPWTFSPDQKDLTVKVGESSLAFYTAVNNSDHPVTGTATFNVTPLKAGLYFSKVDCFCFEEQTLAPGEKAIMPVSFFVDPEINEDKNLDEIETITLSYTFFRKQDKTASRGTSLPVAN